MPHIKSIDPEAVPPIAGTPESDTFDVLARWNICAWSIDRPWAVLATYGAAMFLAAMVVFGGVMPKRMMPFVESPLVGVIASAPGMSSLEVESRITKPIEEHLSGVRGVRFMRSTSREGLSIVTLEFPYGSDMKRATADVQGQMNQIEADLPRTGSNIAHPIVAPIDPLNLPVLTLAVTGDPSQGWSREKLRAFAENELVNALKQVDNVQSVQVFGGQKRQIAINVDRDKLAAAGYSLIDVRNAIDNQSVSEPAGSLVTSRTDTALRIEATAQRGQDILDYPIGSRNGHVICIGDVADVVDGPREQQSGYHYIGPLSSSEATATTGFAHRPVMGLNDEAIELSIVQNPSAGSGPVVDDVMAKIARIKEQYPGLHFNQAYDNAHFVNILFQNTGEELAIAVLLCALVVWAFMGSPRAAAISITTIPVSLAMAILMMAPFGFSLNSSTMVGLLIAIGRLVDDSVIDIHAVDRHLRMGKTARQATIDGITEVRMAVAASTLMLVLALIPLLVCGGITQLMFVGLVYPIIFGLISSFIVSLTLTAVLSAHLPRRPESAPSGKLSRVAARLDRFDHSYGQLVTFLLKNKATVILLSLAVISVGFGFYNFIGSEMMPLADVGQAYAVLEMRPGTSYRQTEEATAKFENILARYPEIERVSTEIGTEPTGSYFNGYERRQLNAATMMITLTDKDRRSRDIWSIVDNARAVAISTIPNISMLQIKEMGSDVMATSSAPVEILVTGPDLGVLNQLAMKIVGHGSTPLKSVYSGAYQVAMSWEIDKPSYRINVDARRAALFGLTPRDVAEQAYYATAGGLTNEQFRVPDERDDNISIQYRADQRRTPYDLEQVRIVGANGVQAPLSSLATFTRELIPRAIDHDGMQRCVSVMAAYRKGSQPSMDLAMDILTSASGSICFPPGYSMEMRGDMTQMMDSFARLLRGLVIALILIFFVLVAQFRGPLMPFQMLLSIPLELTGVFAGLYFAHQSFSTVSILGLIVLTGMDITAAILLIDQIVRRRTERSGAHGLLDETLADRDAAIAEACQDRLRPILMTAIITIVTMAPVAFAPKTGIDAYQPLGVVIVAGLIAGTILSLLVIPVMHATMDDIVRWMRRGRSRSV